MQLPLTVQLYCDRNKHKSLSWYLPVCELCPNRKCVKEWEEPHDSSLYCIQTDGNHMIASGSSYYGVVRLWDKRQSECLQVCTVYPPRGRNDTCRQVENTILWADADVKQQAKCTCNLVWCCACCAVLPAVLSPSDQPSVLPEVQQLTPVRSAGQHPAVARLQPEPHRDQMIHKLSETTSAIKIFLQ